MFSNRDYERANTDRIQVSAVLLGLAIPFSDGLRAIEAFPNLGLVFLALSGVVSIAAALAEVYLIEAVGALNGALAVVLKVYLRLAHADQTTAKLTRLRTSF